MVRARLLRPAVRIVARHPDMVPVLSVREFFSQLLHAERSACRNTSADDDQENQYYTGKTFHEIVPFQQILTGGGCVMFGFQAVVFGAEVRAEEGSIVDIGAK